MALAEGETFGTVVPGFVTDADGNLSLADTGTQWVNGFWRDDDGRLAYTETWDDTEFGTVVPGFLTDADGALVLSTTVGARTNLYTNPTFETNVTGPSPIRADVAQSATQAYDGTYSIELTSTAAQYYIRQIGTTNIPGVAGTTYTLSAYIYQTVSGRAARAVLLFYDAGASIVGSATTGTSVTATQNAWVRFGVTATAPANTVHIAYYLYGDYNASGSASEVCYMDAILLEAASSAADYFPTESQLAAGEAAWTGTANASASTGVAPLRGKKVPGFWTDENGALIIEDQPSTTTWDGGFLRNPSGHLAVVVPS